LQISFRKSIIKIFIRKLNICRKKGKKTNVSLNLDYQSSFKSFNWYPHINQNHF